MTSQSKGKSSKTVIDRPGTNWKETSLEGSSLILSVVKEAATFAPVAELKRAACSALLIFKTIQNLKEETYERLGYDSSGLIIAIWRSFEKADGPEEWLSAEMRDILHDLSHTLENICSFINEQLSKSKAIRVIFRRADGVKIDEFLEHLKYLTHKFESHMNMNDGLIRVPKNDQTSEWELEQLTGVEINRQEEDERWLSDELKKIEKETRDRKSELKRLREAVHESRLEEANRLRKAEEEEIAQLKLELAANVANRQSNKIRARSSGKMRVRQEDAVDDEDWEGNTMVNSEEAAPGDEEERPVRRSSKVKRNASQSLKGRPGAVAREDSADDEEDDLHSMSMRSAEARRKLSSASLRVQETEDNYTDTDEEDDYALPPPRRSPKVKRKRQSSSSTRPSSVDDLMAQFQGFTPMGLASNARSSSPIYMPVLGVPVHSTYGASFSPPIGPYGYGGGMPGLVVNAGIGNINTSTISNVGNVHRRRSQRRHAGN